MTQNSVSYHAWQSGAAPIGGRRVRFASKPGAFSHGTIDPAALLLARYTTIASGDVVVQLNCGNGLFGAAALMVGDASRVLLADRNVLSFQATERTLALNELTQGTVTLAQGSHAFPADTVADVVAVRIPHEKLAQLQLLVDAWRLLRIGGRCTIAGATNEGAKSAARLLEVIFGNCQVLASESGYRVVAATKRTESLPEASELTSPFLAPDAFHEIDATLRGAALTLCTRPGVFSWEHLDEATEVLSACMEIPSQASVLDLGCGAGPLGVVASRLSGGGPVTLVDADVEAIRSTQRTVQGAGVSDARAMCSDIAVAVLGEQFDVVVTNPPFHVGKSTALNVPMQFMRDAYLVLRPGGALFLVANRTLPYEQPLTDLFGHVRTVHDCARFKVLSATRR